MALTILCSGRAMFHKPVVALLLMSVIFTNAGTQWEKEVVCKCKSQYCETVKHLLDEQCKKVTEPDESRYGIERPHSSFRTYRRNSKRNLEINWKGYKHTKHSKNRSFFLKLSSRSDYNFRACYQVTMTKQNIEKQTGEVTHRIRCIGDQDLKDVTASWCREKPYIQRSDSPERAEGSPSRSARALKEETSLLRKQTNIPTTLITSATTPKDSCAEWKPREFHVNLIIDDDKTKTVQILWEPMFHASDLDVGFVHEDAPFSFVAYHMIKKWRRVTRLSWNSHKKSVTFHNVSVRPGTYIAYIRATGCTDCLLPAYTTCNTDYTRSDPFTMPDDITTGESVLRDPAIGREGEPTESVKSESTHSHLFIILGVLLAAIWCLFVLCGYSLFRGYLPCLKTTNVPRSEGVPQVSNIEFTSRFPLVRERVESVFVIYSPDCQHHIDAVKSFVNLLQDVGKRVVLDRDPKFNNDVRENLFVWTEKQVQDSDCILIIQSETLAKLFNAYGKKDPGPFKRSNDVYIEIGPYALDLLRRHHKSTVFHVNFGYGPNDIQRHFPQYKSYEVTYKSVWKERSGSERNLKLRRLFFDVSASDDSIERAVASEEASIFLKHVVNMETYIKSNPD